jgi:hypothetical protein
MTSWKILLALLVNIVVAFYNAKLRKLYKNFVQNNRYQIMKCV